MQERRQRVGSQPQTSASGSDATQASGSQQQQGADSTAPTPLALLAARRQASRRISGDGNVPGAHDTMPQAQHDGVSPAAPNPTPVEAATQQQQQQQPRGLARLPSRRSSFAGAAGAPAAAAGTAPVAAAPAAFPMPSLPPLRTSMPAQAAWRTRTANGQQLAAMLPSSSQAWAPAPATAAPGGAAAVAAAGSLAAAPASPGVAAPRPNSVNAAGAAAASGYAAAGPDQALQAAYAPSADAPSSGQAGAAAAPVVPEPNRFVVYDNPLGADGRPSAATGQPEQPLSASDHMGRGPDGAFRDQDPHKQHDQQHGAPKQGPGQQQQPFTAMQGQGQGQQQPMVYNAETGLLTRGEGQDHTHVAHHYIEDWSSGQFYELQEQPGCFSCCRRRRPLAQQQPGPGIGFEDIADDVIASTLQTLERFAYVWSDWSGVLGLFVQGLCGGLALMCLFMTYLMYLGSGTTAFLAYYGPLAENLNRAYFALVSLSLVASASKWATDKLAQYAPKALRLRAADAAATLLFIGAYVCNLLATPLDDQLTYEAARDPSFWALPMPSAFSSRLSLWHALNLGRVACCIFAWLLCCYMASPHVVCGVVAARRGARYVAGGVGAAEGTGAVAAASAGRGVGAVVRGGQGQERGTWEAVPPVAL